MNLNEHRKSIEKNPIVYSTDLEDDRLVKTLINHIKDDFPAVRFNKKKKLILKEIVTLIFETQDHRPFFHVEDTELPLCWNGPKNWECNYIKYEWGHLLSRNQNSVNEKSILENLGLYSARCNQHIQSSLNIQELMLYGGLISQRITNVLTKRRILFESPRWDRIIEELKK
jgi:hypothetical protein